MCVALARVVVGGAHSGVCRGAPARVGRVGSAPARVGRAALARVTWIGTAPARVAVMGVGLARVA